MSRLFTFGCSFTRYWRWPTWANIVGRGFDHFENWGICGGGNQVIFNSLIECNQRRSIGPDDTVIIMWTSTSREDHYVTDHWIEGGNVYWPGGPYPEAYLAEFACERGYLIRDLAFVAAATQLLDAWGCQSRQVSMVPLRQTNLESGLGTRGQPVPLADVHRVYASVLDSIGPSVFETVFDSAWRGRPGIADLSNPRTRDFHPTPAEHLEYCDLVLPEFAVSDETRNNILELDQKLRAGESVPWSYGTNEPRRL